MIPAHDWNALGICCPRCLQALAPDGPQVLCCRSCAAVFPVHFGIPDLRTGEDPYLSRAADVAAATALHDRAERMDFRTLLVSYYETNDKVPPAQVAMFTHGTIAAADRAATTLSAWLRQDADVRRWLANDDVVLDIGCGTGPLAIAAAHAGFRAIGVDVGLRWLILARKRAAEAGVNVTFVCANAEALPFRDGLASRAGGESIIENAADPERALREVARVLRRGGRLWLTTPNKHSLGPDPHLGVMAAGWWPEEWLKRHAARSGKVFPRRTLFSRGALRRALSEAGFAQIAIALPDFAPAQIQSQPLAIRTAIAGYQVAKRMPVAGSLLRVVAPTYLVTATRT
ncbi:MAG: methyltransferase domain-containing protein [Gemmatimonadota bacterium]